MTHPPVLNLSLPLAWQAPLKPRLCHHLEKARPIPPSWVGDFCGAPSVTYDCLPWRLPIHPSVHSISSKGKPPQCTQIRQTTLHIYFIALLQSVLRFSILQYLSQTPNYKFHEEQDLLGLYHSLYPCTYHSIWPALKLNR